MKNYIPIISAIVALIGVGAGAAISHFSSRSLYLQSSSLEYQRTSYRDFVEFQAMYRKANDYDDEELLKKAKIGLRDAITRIAVFSPANVTHSFSTWMAERWKNNDCERPKESVLLDLNLYHSMRLEAFYGNKEQELSDAEMAYLIFGCNIELKPKLKAKVILKPNRANSTDANETEKVTDIFN